MNIQTVYISKIVDEQRMLEVARQKAEQHPDKLQNVCYHSQTTLGHNDKCYTMDLSKEGVSDE